MRAARRGEDHSRARWCCGGWARAGAAGAPSGYDISRDPARGRWYIDASWTIQHGPAPSLDELRRRPVVSVDVNAGHLEAAVLVPDGNVTGTPFTIPLDLTGLPAAARDGRLRAAISIIIATARRHGARSIVIEDLDFAEARAEGRERSGTAHRADGAAGRSGGRSPAFPPPKLRDRLTQMTANADLSVVVVDPAYTQPLGSRALVAAPARAPP